MWQVHLVMVMLRRGINLFLVFFLIACENKNETHDITNEVKKVSINLVGQQNYTHIVSIMNDSIKHWKLNNLRKYIEVEGTSEYIADSLLCFNNNKTRFITCLIGKVLLKPNPTAGITFFYGEKINNLWYFFSGNHIFIPHEMKNIKDGNPFDFKELHQISLKEVYNGYLKSNGEINEEWFISHFENVGWCSTCKTTEDFQKSRLEDVKTLWLQRDTTQPIKQLP